MNDRWTSATSSVKDLETLYSGSVFVAHSLYRFVVAGVPVDSLSFCSDESWEQFTEDQRSQFEESDFWERHKDIFSVSDINAAYSATRYLDTARIIKGVLRNPKAWSDGFYTERGAFRYAIEDSKNANYAQIAYDLFATKENPTPIEMWMSLFIGNNVGSGAPRNLSNFVERIKTRTDPTTAIMRMALVVGSSSYMMNILSGSNEGFSERVLDDGVWLKNARLDVNDAVLLAAVDIHLGNPCLFVPQVHSLVLAGHSLDDIINLRKMGVTDYETILAVLDNSIDDETLRTVIETKGGECRVPYMLSNQACDSV